MDINQLAMGAAPNDGFKQHPCGEFNAIVKSITQKMVVDRRVWELELETSAGTCSYTIWDFNQSDIQRLYSDPSFKDKVINAIGRVKRLFVDLGCASVDDVTKIPWDTGHINCVAMLPTLKGKRCTAVVMESSRKAGQRVVFINAPVEAPKEPSIDAHNMGWDQRPSNQSQQRPAFQPAHQGNVQRGQYNGQSLDDIPF